MRFHRHIGAYGIIIYDNSIVLIKKARGAYTGKLDLPGGGFEHGETPEQCVTREILEETNLKVEKLKLQNVCSANIKWTDEEEEDLHHIGVIYYVVISTFEGLKKDEDGLDSLGAKLYDINSLKGDELSPFANYAINLVKHEKEKIMKNEVNSESSMRVYALMITESWIEEFRVAFLNSVKVQNSIFEQFHVLPSYQQIFVDTVRNENMVEGWNSAKEFYARWNSEQVKAYRASLKENIFLRNAGYRNPDFIWAFKAYIKS